MSSHAALRASLVLSALAASVLPLFPDAGTAEPGAAARTPGPSSAGAGRAAPVVLCPYPGDEAMWDYICGQEGSFDLSAGVRGLVLPHHFSDQFELAAAWRSAAAELDPPLVVILSPDHYLAGASDVSLPDSVRFSTVYGDLPVDRGLAAAVAGADARFRARSDAPFPAEHGVAVHTAFIRRYFPRASILPVLLKPGIPAERLDALASDLVRQAPPGTLFVASVDASHYNPVALSRFHDAMTVAALESMDGSRILGAEVDSPESLYAFNAVMYALGVRTARLFLRTDLQSHFSRPIADNTSHLYLRYGHGPDAESKPEPALTLLALPLPARSSDAPAGLERAWTWDWRDPERTTRLYPRLVALAGAGEEDRRFTGSDLYLFGASEPGPHRWAIGGVRVAVARVAVRDGADRAAWADELADGRAWAGCLVAVIDADQGEAPSAALASAEDEAVEAGADLAIIRDPAAEAYAERRRGRTLVCVLPGYLTLPLGRADGPSAALAAVWRPEGWTLTRLDLRHVSGSPVLADLPAAKSYDPPPVFTERE